MFKEYGPDRDEVLDMAYYAGWFDASSHDTVPNVFLQCLVEDVNEYDLDPEEYEALERSFQAGRRAALDHHRREEV